MGIAKRVRVGEREVRVFTVKYTDWQRLLLDKKKVTLLDLTLACVNEEDKAYLESIEHEGDTNIEEQFKQLLTFTVDVNPSLFKTGESDAVKKEATP